MTSKATEDMLAALHAAVANDFIKKIASGEATAAELSAAVRFLKDNGIDCTGSQNATMTSLAETMSFPVDVEDDDGTVVRISR